ncbi:MAG: hypothetical protein N2517_05205 [Ignavibacteria bacterium]|nr:hypothetical protein [Ignavibacteria bacterium]
MKKEVLLCLIFFAFLLWFSPTNAQDEATRTEMEMILSKFTNYRFGNISLYRLKNVADVRRAIRLRQERAAGIKIDENILKAVDQAILNEVEQGVKGGDDLTTIVQTIERRGLIAPERSVMEQVYQYYRQKYEGAAEQRVENAYLVTTKTPHTEIPRTIIALILSYSQSTDLEKSLKNIGSGDIYTYDELKNFKLDETFAADNLYDLMVSALLQRNVTNVTLEAQGIGNVQWFARKVFGITESPFSNEADLLSTDIQRTKRITDGSPFDFGLKQHELLVSPDWILWRRYPAPGYYDDNGNFVVDPEGNSNSELPLFGLELKYGIDCINYTSFFGERVTLSAIWQNVKFGIILPTDGWASIGKDLFSIQRKLTFGGFGLAGSFDFPIKVIPKSGVFHVDFGYVFGDAKESKYKGRNIDTLFYDPGLALASSDFDYLIRSNAQAYYTFSARIDNNYYFRFGLGATFYQVEKWFNDLDTADFRRKLNFRKYDEVIVGDVAVKIDFMVDNVATPFGFNAQYFNGGIGGGVWLQIPIIQNTLTLRLDARGYLVPFKDNPEPWENKGYFVPMARFIVNF